LLLWYRRFGPAGRGGPAPEPDCDIRVGDMHALPRDPASFDVVTSFRGIWGTTPRAVAEYTGSFAPADAPG